MSAYPSRAVLASVQDNFDRIADAMVGPMIAQAEREQAQMERQFERVMAATERDYERGMAAIERDFCTQEGRS